MRSTIYGSTWDPSVPPFLVRQAHEAEKRQRQQAQRAIDAERQAVIEASKQYGPFARVGYPRRQSAPKAIDPTAIYAARRQA